MNDLFVKPSDLAPLTKARSVDINNLSSAVAAAFEKVPPTAVGFSALANFAPDVSLVANTIKFSISANVAALVDGMQFRVKLANGLNGAASATVTGLGTFPVRRPDGSNPGGDYVAGQVVDLTYLAAAGGSFQLPAQVQNVAAGAGLPLAGGTMTGPLNRAKGASVASAAALDLQNVTGNVVHITGTATVTSINLAAGADRECIADAAFTLTHSATLKLPGAANILATAGDSFTVLGDGSGNVIVTKYTRVDGNPNTRQLGLVPIGAMLAFDSDAQANVITKNGDTYLKTGVIADASSYPLSLAGPYATTVSTTSPVIAVPDIVVSMASGNGMIVAVNGAGQIYYSKEGMEWGNAGQFNSASNYGYVCFANGMFIVAFPNAIFRSTDGINWTQVQAVTGPTNTTGVAYGNGLWVVIYSNQIPYYTSPDGITWTLRNLPSALAALSKAWNGALLFSTMFVGFGGSSTILTSPDGLNWTARTGAAATPQSIAYGNGMYVVTYNNATAANEVFSSPDLITWTARGTGQVVSASFGVNFLAGRFVIQDASTNFFYSTNGTAWTTVANAGTTTTPIGASCISSDGAYAIGFPTSSTMNPYRLSNNTNTWMGSSVIANTTIASFEWANDRFVMYYSNTSNWYLDVSFDGKAWWHANSGAGSKSSVVYFAGKFNMFTTTSWATSTDCLVWTAVTTNLPPNYATNTCAIVANGRLYLFTATGFCYTTDGISWTAGTFASAVWRGIVYGNNTYVAFSIVDNLQPYATSADGLAWTSRSNAVFGGAQLVGVVFASGFFIAATINGQLYKSADGVTWALMSNYAYGYQPTAFTGITTDGTTIVVTNAADPTIVMWNGAAGDPLYRRGILKPVESVTPSVTNVSALRCSPAGRFAGKALNRNYSYGDILAVPKVCNDINYKTFDAAGVARTDFYKRVA